MAAGYDGSIRIDTRLNTGNFNKGISEITRSMKKLGAAIGVSFGVSALIKLGKEAINTASDLAEVQNVVDVAFGSMSDMVEEFAETSIEKFGMSELAAKRTASTYMAMNKGMGLFSRQSAQMAIDAAARTGDIASFYNKTQQEADTMMKSVWTGETESLKSIGVVMTQTNLDNFALANGFNKTTSAMTQQELVMLRYMFVMEKTRLAAGDFERTSGSWANQTRILTENFGDFLSIMGTGFIQVLTPAIKTVNKLMASLINLAKVFSKVTGALFDRQIVNDAAASTENAAEAQNDYAAATKKAEKAQKGFLSGLDDITALNEQNADSGVGSAAIPSLPSSDTDLPAGKRGDKLELSPKLQEITDKLINFFTTTKNFINEHKPLWKTLTAVIAGFFAVWEIVKLMSFIQQAGGLGVVLGKLITVFKALTVAKVKDLAETAALHLMYAKDFIVSVAQSTVALAKQAGQWIVTTAAKIADTVATTAATAATWLFNAALTVLTSPITLVVVAIAALIAIVILLIKHWDDVKEAAKVCWDWIVSVWESASAWFNDKVITPISGYFGELKENIKNFFANAKESAQEKWKDIGEWFKDKIITPVSKIFSYLGVDIKEAFSSPLAFITSAFKLYVNTWITIIEKFINFFINGINTLTARLSSFKFDIPDWVPKIGGKAFGINIGKMPSVSLPRLATGAVIPPNAEFAAILGDQKHGRNLEAPEGLIRQIVREEGAIQLTVILQMPDGKQKTVFDTKAVTRANRQSGKILIPVEV